MLKQILVFTLLAAFAVQTFSQGLIVYCFYSNQETIAAKYCVNKARPKMHCEGKCQLMKKLQQQEKEEKDNTERKPTNKTDLVFSKPVHTAIVFFNSKITSPLFPRYEETIIDDHLSAILRPPQV